jgi:signal transduction histidine kinase
MVGVHYSDAFAVAFAGNTWIILVAVLAPVCFLVDVIFMILALLWQRRKKLLKLEERKRKDAQVMIGYVNHEIRNPLQTILGLAELELEEAQDAGSLRMADNLKAIVGAAEFIEHIATDILDLRRVEEGKVDMEMSEVDVEVLLKGLERSVRPLQAKKPGIELKVNVDQEIRTIRTDRYRLEQILMNFLTNAFKHTEQGLVTLSVSFATVSWVRFSVWDTGKGIPPDKTARLFQQFAQVSSKDSSDLGGFGLGLYLTKMLADLLGGRVGFESTFGLGSVFWVDLPVEWDKRSLSFQFQKSETLLHHPVGFVT